MLTKLLRSTWCVKILLHVRIIVENFYRIGQEVRHGVSTDSLQVSLSGSLNPNRLIDFLIVYNYTNDMNYWVTSRRLAEYYLSRLPSSGVPPWYACFLRLFPSTEALLLRDFDAPDVAGRPSDTSSATIAASGMLMLSRFEQGASNTTGASYWADAAVRVSAKPEFIVMGSTLCILTVF